MSKKITPDQLNFVTAINGRRYFADGGPTSPGLNNPQTVGPTIAPSVQTLAATNGGNGDQSLGNAMASFFGGNAYFNAQLAPTTQQDYSGLISNAGTQAMSYAPQQQAAFSNMGMGANALMGLGNQAQQWAMGQGGPSLAQTQLAQTTGQNVANQAALMAGQRGVGANSGMMARQIAQQGANTQQQAAGQAAILRAQEQLNQQQMAAQAYGAANNAYGNQAGALTNAQNAYGNIFGTAGGLQNTQNANLITNYGNAQGINAKIAQTNAEAAQKAGGGLMQGIGALMAMNQGGRVNYDDGGTVMPYPQVQGPNPGMSMPTPITNQPVLGGPSSGQMSFVQPQQQMPTPQQQGGGQVAQPLSTMGSFLMGNSNKDKQDDSVGLGALMQGYSSMAGMARGGRVPAMVSPDEIVLSRDEASNPQRAAQMAALKEKYDHKVPGKAKVKGDSIKNDTVPMDLEAGGIVIPRSHATSPDKAAMFAYHVAMKKGRK